MLSAHPSAHVGSILPLLAGEAYKKWLLPKIDKSVPTPKMVSGTTPKKHSSLADKFAGADPTLEDEYDDIPDMPVNAGVDLLCRVGIERK